jgi:hypothetical protein
MYPSCANFSGWFRLKVNHVKCLISLCLQNVFLKFRVGGGGGSCPGSPLPPWVRPWLRFITDCSSYSIQFLAHTQYIHRPSPVSLTPCTLVARQLRHPRFFCSLSPCHTGKHGLVWSYFRLDDAGWRNPGARSSSTWQNNPVICGSYLNCWVHWIQLLQLP